MTVQDAHENPTNAHYQRPPDIVPAYRNQRRECGSLEPLQQHQQSNIMGPRQAHDPWSPYSGRSINSNTPIFSPPASALACVPMPPHAPELRQGEGYDMWPSVASSKSQVSEALTENIDRPPSANPIGPPRDASNGHRPQQRSRRKGPLKDQTRENAKDMRGKACWRCALSRRTVRRHLIRQSCG